MPQDLPFQIGETVKHINPNSPNMTVAWVDGEIITVQWFDGLGRLQQSDFHPFYLTPVPPMVTPARPAAR